jgi:hypothetical protein
MLLYWDARPCVFTSKGPSLGFTNLMFETDILSRSLGPVFSGFNLRVGNVKSLVTRSHKPLRKPECYSLTPAKPSAEGYSSRTGKGTGWSWVLSPTGSPCSLTKVRELDPHNGCPQPKGQGYSHPQARPSAAHEKSSWSLPTPGQPSSQRQGFWLPSLDFWLNITNNLIKNRQ